MIKLESELLTKRGIVAFSLTASTPEELKTLDLFNEAIQGAYTMDTGFRSSNHLVIHVRGMPDHYFPTDEKKNG